MLTEQMRSFAPRQLQRLSRNCCLPGTFAGRMHLTFAEGLQETFDFGPLSHFGRPQRLQVRTCA